MNRIITTEDAACFIQRNLSIRPHTLILIFEWFVWSYFIVPGWRATEGAKRSCYIYQQPITVAVIISLRSAISSASDWDFLDIIISCLICSIDTENHNCLLQNVLEVLQEVHRHNGIFNGASDIMLTKLSRNESTISTAGQDREVK